MKPPDLDQTYTLVSNKLTRSYLVHTPVGWDGVTPIPCLVGLHGGGGKSEGFQRQSKFSAVADTNQFLFVCPDGTGLKADSTLLSWNAGTCCSHALKNDVDDVSFLRDLVDRLKGQFPIVKNQIYGTGFSNGAMMCYQVARLAPDVFTAIAPVSGDMGILSPVPVGPVPVIHFHGLLDTHCPFNGGTVPTDLDPVYHQPIRTVIATWVAINKCNPAPADAIGSDWASELYEGNNPVELYTLPTGGHQWPGGAKIGTDPIVTDVDASAIIWAWFMGLSS